MFVRLALESDQEAVVQMAKGNVDETLHETEFFNPDCVRLTFQSYLTVAASTFFVVVEEETVIGFLQATMFGYDYRDGLYTCQKVLYVVPEKRGTRAATLLMRELISWSRLLGADRIEGGNDNSFRSDKTASFLARFGFEQVGYAMRLKLGTK